jgi:hypothetical protein
MAVAVRAVGAVRDCETTFGAGADPTELVFMPVDALM